MTATVFDVEATPPDWPIYPSDTVYAAREAMAARSLVNSGRSRSGAKTGSMGNVHPKGPGDGAATADASITAVAGVAVAFGPRPSTGFAVALKPHPGPVSVEFEYVRSGRDPVVSGSAFATFSGNILVQPLQQRSPFQFYGTLGVGLYSLIRDYQGSTDSARNIGGGAKVALAGPWKLRMDYRALLLARSGGEHHAHRFYVGIAAGF